MRTRDPIHAPDFEAYLARRLDHEPIPYILGTWEFFSLEFLCRAPVLVPRPETEHLVEAAIAHLAGKTAPRVLDLCTGTGCVAISIAKNCPGATVTAVDLQPHAIALAKENSARNAANVSVLRGDLFAALPAGDAPFNAIVSNPPYISRAEYATLSPIILKHEDPIALLAGADGLDIIDRLLREAHGWLVPGGLLAIEIGETQSEVVTAKCRCDKWGNVSVLPDLAGHPRIFTATRLPDPA